MSSFESKERSVILIDPAPRGAPQVLELASVSQLARMLL
jgi:hypothetical protein